MGSYERYLYWLENEYFDIETRAELAKIGNKPKEIEDRFYKDLEFGTGGLRGIIGAGTNRMNVYTVRKASQGLADHVAKRGEDAKMRGIVIAYDSRYRSQEFALEAARVFAGNGIRAYLFDELKPTPELSFAVRLLHAVFGIVITASHNPREYNGYKVYGEDGAQLPPKVTGLILEEINGITDITRVKLIEKEAAVCTGLLKIIGKEIDDEYISKLKALCVDGSIVKRISEPLKIVYTPLHGAGNKLVRRILAETGFSHVSVVKKQELPDGGFPYAGPSPNPEEKGVFKYAVKMARSEDADLIIGTDPDCDRMGVMARKSKGRYVMLTGNQVGALLMEYILSHKKEQFPLPQNAFVVKTIVTTELARAIANYYNVRIYDVLTGFKYIGEIIGEKEDLKGDKFLLGFEDSCGFLTGTDVRDKDGVLAAMLIAETAAHYKREGMSLYEGLQSIYEKYGFYSGDMNYFTLRGKEGLDRIKYIMSRIRNDACKILDNIDIIAVRDYLEQARHDLRTGKKETLNLPKSDALFFEINDGSWFCIRPSGTEPKVKVYFEACDRNMKLAEKRLRCLQKNILRKIRGLCRESSLRKREG